MKLWDKVDKTPSCWVWTAYRNAGGYGLVGRGGKSYLAHRMAYEELVGPIPAGLCVLHRCDNPACIRPDHLFLGSRGDNNRDRDRKGRNRMQVAGRWTTRGSDNLRSVLDEEKIRLIRASTKSVKEIAEEFGIGKTTVFDVRNRNTWKHIK